MILMQLPGSSLLMLLLPMPACRLGVAVRAVTASAPDSEAGPLEVRSLVFNHIGK